MRSTKVKLILRDGSVYHNAKIYFDGALQIIHKDVPYDLVSQCVVHDLIKSITFYENQEI